MSITSVYAQNIKTNIESLNNDKLYKRANDNTALEGTRDFIKSQFQAIGLSELADSYSDDFEVKGGLSLGENRVAFAVIVPRLGIPMDRIKPSIQTWDSKKDWLPLGFSSAGNISDAEIAFTGYGISAPDYDDYKDLDVKDKVVIVLTDTPEGTKSEKYADYNSYEYKVKNAQKHGAAAVFFIKAMGDSANVFEPVIVDKFNSGIVALQVNRATLERYFPRKQPLIDQEKAIRASKSPKSFVLPNVKANISLELEAKNQTFTNLYGFVEGADQDRNIIIAFPYDEELSDKNIEDYVKKQGKFYYKSGNNISGIAAALELARRFKENEAPVNIIFAALSGEEPDFHGSKQLLSSLGDKVENSSAIFYIDNTEKVHKRHLTIYSNDPLIVDNFRNVETFKSLNVEAKELSADDTNPIHNLNKKYVLILNKLRSYPAPTREWSDSDFSELTDYVNLLENTIRNLTQN
jgi:hypothetical protein